jgi:cell division protein ZapA
MDDEIRINLVIAGCTYPLTINREEEEGIREAAKRVNLKLNMYRNKFPTLPLEKIITMVAYDFSLRNIQQEKRHDTKPYTEKIEELTKVLEDCFKEE